MGAGGVVVEACAALVALGTECAAKQRGVSRAAEEVVVHASHTATLELAALERGGRGRGGEGRGVGRV